MTTYYIQPGKDTKMYTLRKRWSEEAETRNGSVTVVHDVYLQNLSTEADRALEKAKILADGPVTTGELEPLEEIRRRESAEIEAARVQAEAEEMALQVQRKERLINAICAGLWPFGAFKGQDFERADLSYVQFFLKLENEGNDSVLETLQNALSLAFPQLVNLPVPNGDYVGEVKKRQNFTATLVEAFSFEGFYGTVFIRKFVKDSGELLVYKGSTPASCKGSELGQVKRFKATVKAHSEYKGQNQTEIQRLKEL